MFAQDCRTRSDSTWHDIFHAPLVQGMGDGTLTPERFVSCFSVALSWHQQYWPQPMGVE